MTTEQVLEEAEKLGQQTSGEQLLKAHTDTTSAAQTATVVKRQGIPVDALLSPDSPLSEESIQKQLQMQKNLIVLDSHIANCLATKTEWLEYDPAVIAHLCGGRVPNAGYMMYKNIRLCLPGQADKIAAKERLTITQLMYVEEGKAFVAKS